jgi:hypothetical protein
MMKVKSGGNYTVSRDKTIGFLTLIYYVVYILNHDTYKRPLNPKNDTPEKFIP